MYQSIHTLNYDQHTIEAYTTIQTWYKGILTARQEYLAMIFRYAMRMWKRLLSACRSIQRAFLSRKSAKKMKKKLKQDRQVGMTASLNIAMGVKLRAAKAVAATNQRTVKAATILQTRICSFHSMAVHFP